MPINDITKAALEAKLPDANSTRERVRRYMLAADLSTSQFCSHVGYSAAALSKFLSGVYTEGTGKIARTDLLIRDALESYMARHPLESASVGTVAGHLYETENVEQIRHWFEHCQANRALAFVYGPPGSQKSFVLQHLIAGFNRRELGREASVNRAYYIYVSVNIQPRDLLRKICAECGAPAGATLQACMSGLRHHLRHTQTVIVLDEAQNASIAALEAMRELHDTEPHLGILLAGSHGLKQFFDQRAAELEQWNSRLDAGVELAGVSDSTARAILGLECPELEAEQIEQLIAGSRVPDPYSARRGHTYLSMRRLFKTVAAIQRLPHPNPQPDVEISEVLQ